LSTVPPVGIRGYHELRWLAPLRFIRATGFSILVLGLTIGPLVRRSLEQNES